MGSVGQFDFDEVVQDFPSPRADTHLGSSPSRWEGINSAGSLGSITRDGEAVFFPESGYLQQSRSHSGPSAISSNLNGQSEANGAAAKQFSYEKRLKRANRRDEHSNELSCQTEEQEAENSLALDMADALLALPSSPHYFVLPSPTMSELGCLTEGYGDPSSSSRSSFFGHSGLLSGGSSAAGSSSSSGFRSGSHFSFPLPLTGQAYSNPNPSSAPRGTISLTRAVPSERKDVCAVRLLLYHYCLFLFLELH